MRGRKSPLFIPMISKNKVVELANDRIVELDNGCYLVDVTISSTNSILVEIDGASSGVSVNDCISVSRNIEHNLDREKCDFELKVTSPGLDQPLKVRKQYVKNIGRKVKVVLNNHGSFEGLLSSVEEDFIVLNWEEKERIEGKKKKVLVEKSAQVYFKDIKETKVVISFK